MRETSCLSTSTLKESSLGAWTTPMNRLCSLLKVTGIKRGFGCGGVPAEVRFALVGGKDSHLYHLAMKDGKERKAKNFAGRDFGGGIAALAFPLLPMKDKAVMYLGTEKGRVFALDLTGSKITREFEAHSNMIDNLAISHDGNTLISSCCEGESTRIAKRRLQTLHTLIRRFAPRAPCRSP